MLNVDPTGKSAPVFIERRRSDCRPKRLVPKYLVDGFSDFPAFANPLGEAAPVEIFQDLDRHVAADIGGVPEIGGGEHAVFRFLGEALGQATHIPHCGGRIKRFLATA